MSVCVCQPASQPKFRTDSSFNLIFHVLLYLTSAIKCHLFCIGPPKLAEAYQRRYDASMGHSVRLVCPVISSELQDSGPAPLYSWTKDGREIHAGWPRYKIGDGTLRIRELQLDDAGVYCCLATNGFGSAQATLLVNVKGMTLYWISRTPAQDSLRFDNSIFRLFRNDRICYV
jgi:hypothetical protein